MTCHYRQYVSTVCQQLNPGTWSKLGTSGGCFAGGSDFTYSDQYYATGGPKFQLRSSADPYITALSLTGGSLDFGYTQAQNATIGGITLGLGLCLMLPMACILYCVAKRNQSNPDMQASNFESNAGPQPPPPVHDVYAGQQPSAPGAAPSAYGNYGQQPGVYHAPAPAYSGGPAPPPVAPGQLPEQQQPPLPPGWEEAYDESSGTSYYYSSVTNQTVWDRPY